jgi:hypothetical protein
MGYDFLPHENPITTFALTPKPITHSPPPRVDAQPGRRSAWRQIGEWGSDRDRERGAGTGALTPKAEKEEDGTPGTRSQSGLRKVKSSPFLAWLKSPVCSSGRSDAVRSLATSRLSSTASGTAAPPPALLPPAELPPPTDPDRDDISRAAAAPGRRCNHRRAAPNPVCGRSPCVLLPPPPFGAEPFFGRRGRAEERVVVV